MNYVLPREVEISDILDDDYFRVSRKRYTASLPLSLKLSGMLEVPWIIEKDNGYIPMTCHNRIGILRETGAESLKCCILDKPDTGIFMNHLSLKSYRNELGPAGKLKSLILLKDTFGISELTLNEFSRKVLKLSGEVINDRKYIKQFFLLRPSLMEYVDEKDVSFKTIRDIVNLPEDWSGIIDSWIKKIQIRVNLFKGLVENVFDIYRRGDSAAVVDSIVLSDDKSLYDEVYKIRFPEYSELKKASEVIIGRLTGQGISVDFPEYFDRGSVTLKLTVSKTHDSRKQLEKISSVDSDTLNKLFELL